MPSVAQLVGALPHALKDCTYVGCKFDPWAGGMEGWGGGEGWRAYMEGN